MTTQKTALVTGATGTSGRAIMHRLADDPSWQVVAVSRRISTDVGIPDNVTVLPVDLTDHDALAAALQEIPITHVFYAAFTGNAPANEPEVHDVQSARRMSRMVGQAMKVLGWLPPVRNTILTQVAEMSYALDRAGTNVKMLQNVLGVTTKAPHQLQHVGMVTGAKYYGMHLTPHIHQDWKIPMEESDPRAPGPNFYYTMEDELQAAASECDFTWSVVRPSFIMGYARHAGTNLLTSMAVYAHLLKAKNMPFIFPSDAGAADCLQTLTDADLLGDLLVWSAETPQAQNNAFNAANGQTIRWRDIWGDIGAYFGLRPDFSQPEFNAQAFMEENVDTWNDIVRLHDLEPNDLHDIAQPNFMTQTFIQDWDVDISMEKAHSLGYDRVVDAVEMFHRHYDRMRENRIIP